VPGTARIPAWRNAPRPIIITGVARTGRWRRKRVVIPVATIVAVIVLLTVSVLAGVIVLTRAAGGSSMSPTVPACDGRTIGEGITYRFRDPHRGEIVVIHARGQIGGPVVPDPDARGLNLGKRVIAIPGDTVVGRGGRVFVNGTKADDIPTDPFPRTRLAADEYFVLGDNRSFSQDSRAFGPVPRDAIFGRVILNYWPLGRFGVPGYDKNLTPPGDVC
jgi:signal peptidase I